MTRVPGVRLTTALTVVSAAAVIVVAGHRVVSWVDRQPFLDPRIGNLTMSAKETTRARPFAASRSTEIVVVLLGSSGCAASRQGVLVSAMNTIRRKLRLVVTPGLRVSFHGVALDDDIAIGLRWLVTVGPFDQVSVGGNWLNSEAVRLLHREFRGQAGVPQLVVLSRTVQTLGTSGLQIAADSILARRLGVEAIDAFANDSNSLRPFVSAVHGSRVGVQ